MEPTLNEPVLVLNANFEPLNVCNTRRAIGLIMLDKATMILNGRGWIHTVKADIPQPSIIRLDRMIKRPRLSVRLTKREIFRRDNFTCQYCGKHTVHLTIDHVIPRHLGGNHCWENLVTACVACNQIKGGRTLEQVHMQFKSIPVSPPASAEYIFHHHILQNRDWVPFIQGW